MLHSCGLRPYFQTLDKARKACHRESERHSSLLRIFVSCQCKKFYNVGPWSLDDFSYQKVNKNSSYKVRSLEELFGNFLLIFGNFKSSDFGGKIAKKFPKIPNNHFLDWPKLFLLNKSRLQHRDTGAWGQCYKTFFVRDLRIFVISESVCPWQAFSIQSNKHSSLLLKLVNCGQKSLITLDNVCILYYKTI